MVQTSTKTKREEKVWCEQGCGEEGLRQDQHRNLGLGWEGTENGERQKDASKGGGLAGGEAGLGHTGRLREPSHLLAQAQGRTGSPWLEELNRPCHRGLQGQTVCIWSHGQKGIIEDFLSGLVIGQSFRFEKFAWQ